MSSEQGRQTQITQETELALAIVHKQTKHGSNKSLLNTHRGGLNENIIYLGHVASMPMGIS